MIPFDLKINKAWALKDKRSEAETGTSLCLGEG